MLFFLLSLLCSPPSSQNEMKKLEAMRLEVDSRRRTVVDLDRQLAMQKMKTMKRAEVRLSQLNTCAHLSIFCILKFR